MEIDRLKRCLLKTASSKYRGAKNILNFIYKLWALAYTCVVMETIMSPPNFRLEVRPLVIVVNSHVLCLCFFSEMSIKHILNSCCLVNFCLLDRLVLSINVLKLIEINHKYAQ